VLCAKALEHTMATRQLVFAQLMSMLPWSSFDRLVKLHRADHKVQSFSCRDQFNAMAFAQLCARQSLRDIEVNLAARSRDLYRMGFRCTGVARNTLANANATRPWQLYADFCRVLIDLALPLYANEPLGLDLQGARVFALDSSTLELCLSLFGWAAHRPTKATVKLHTLLDLQGNIPCFVHVTEGSVGDRAAIDQILASGWVLPGAYYVMDRGYVDYARLAHLAQRGAFFVIRAIDSMRFERLDSAALDELSIAAGVQADDVGLLARHRARQRYAQPLRRVTLHDELGRELVLLTNQFELNAHTVAALYKKRWQVELFFKWIKQHLRIKSFLGTSANAVKTQIWIALSVYLVCAIAKKRLGLHSHSLHDMLRVIELNLFEPVPISDLLTRLNVEPDSGLSPQTELF
jgi:hypothetical protein